MEIAFPLESINSLETGYFDDYSKLWSVHDPQSTISNEETFASELQENVEELFPLYNVHSDNLNNTYVCDRRIVCYSWRR